MTKGVPKKRQRDEQLHKKRAQMAASALANGAKKSPKAIPIPTRPAVQCRALPSGGAPA
ncbi:MAG: hypothetical protein WA231_15965 [Methylocella sp.]